MIGDIVPFTLDKSEPTQDDRTARAADVRAAVGILNESLLAAQKVGLTVTLERSTYGPVWKAIITQEL